jgi:FkbM family methyltransferase
MEMGRFFFGSFAKTFQDCCMGNIRNALRRFLKFSHIDISQNLRYDRLTDKIMQKLLRSNSNCVDVGCHQGEVLKQIIKLAPNGRHYAFEPIPHLCKTLQREFSTAVNVMPFALADSNGTSEFHVVKNALAYSGIRRRSYAVSEPDVEKITVETKRLDDLIPADTCIDFIKIDVEGGEFDVLKGAETLLHRCKPVVVFECGLGASDFYNTQPSELFAFVNAIPGMRISTLKCFLKSLPPLSQQQFVRLYKEKKEYYFIAHPL